MHARIHANTSGISLKASGGHDFIHVAYGEVKGFPLLAARQWNIKRIQENIGICDDAVLFDIKSSDGTFFHSEENRSGPDAAHCRQKTPKEEVTE
ncbi:hypothetical protein [Deinococcus cellulosilyticus]|uniref:Uncharacterized protein n=1 Tax=Deinococcus cellulosilyticus (strain DSM 18568 / NBRC 106333 / KACC 11606 / 5516J-15) TaxID=1223518 RepID=A0A511N317_DEIC1|nr:hypothetical protein [Deinococcus cellulosilyticus]GEM46816.1 hypothetical protein DC3_24510 [Deinococcus cellulosilyticus NBRC 106333 = KACC 11606]